MTQLVNRIAQELGVQTRQVASAVQLLDEGATVPFIARYRKEVTQGLDDTQLRQLEERLAYLRDLDSRRETILRSLEEQGQLTGELKRLLADADTKVRLEDLYRPYKPKRRTKAQVAREQGLGPLAEQILAKPGIAPASLAGEYVSAEMGIASGEEALEGARQILLERFADDPGLVGLLRERLWQEGVLQVQAARGKQQLPEAQKFSDYFDYAEPVRRIPSHRALAVLRGRQAGLLRLKLELESDGTSAAQIHPLALAIAQQTGLSWAGCSSWLQETLQQGWSKKLQPMLETELVARLREAAEAEAIRVFARNLKDLLLAAPAGQQVTLGLDPGLRTGVKATVVDATGKLLEHNAFYPHPPRNRWDVDLEELAALCRRHRVSLISIGNGTASRETDRWVAELQRRHPELRLNKVVVSEAGASVYSASALAAQEFPDLDVSLRGAVSIARRLQDPLAELVKIEPKAIGVGQYQHDVDQLALAQGLDAVVEDCVNAVGVDLNTASAALLSRVAGLTPTLARNIVAYREAQGAFTRRQELLKVSRLGPKAFEQCAGFLRIPNGREPLDASAVHPEAYAVVEKIARQNSRSLGSLIGDRHFLQRLNPADYTDEHFGLPTLRDIFSELEKPGRDPRPEFRIAQFREGVETLKDLTPGMRLEGVVTNVTNFGAFVDIGVHQDGLVHVSALADRFVKDPHEVVKAGDLVQVRVLEVDIARKRIALSMRSESGEGAGNSSRQGEARGRESGRAKQQGAKSKGNQQPRNDAAQTGSLGKLLAEAQAKARSSTGKRKR